MPVTYSVGAKNARMTATRDACANGTLELTTGADAVLASIGLSTAGGTVTGGVWTLTFDGPVVASAAGTAALARIRNNAGTVIVSGLTVGTSGAEVTLDNATFAAGQQVTINAFTITHA